MLTVEEALQIAQRQGCDEFALELTDPAGFLFGTGKPGGDGVFVYAESGEWRPISSDHLFRVRRLIIENEGERLSALNDADVYSVETPHGFVTTSGCIALPALTVSRFGVY